jgi:predicted nucleic acid-binding protein
VSLVVDASVALDWCFESERSAYGERVLEHVLAHQAVVPVIWPSEVANGLLSGLRRSRLTPASLTQAATMLSQLPIEVAPHIGEAPIVRLVQSGREYSLTAYDASYLSLAMARGLPLATRDSALVAAAAKAGVELYESGARVGAA